MHEKTPKQQIRKEKARHGVKLTLQGRLLIAKTIHFPYAKFTTKKRGNIMGFSKASRFRLIKLLATIDWEKALPALFVTLTYPDVAAAPDKGTMSKQRYLFFRRLEEHVGREVPAIWRVEWKQRKTGKHVGLLMPHYHLMIFTVRYLHYAKINDAWCAGRGTTEPARTNAQAMANANQCGYYVSKYCAKPDNTLVNGTYLNTPGGRSWGVHRAGTLPRDTKIERVLPPGPTLEAIREIAAGRFPGVLDGDHSFTLLGEVADVARHLLNDSEPGEA